MEVTAADKLSALWHTFTEPQFYISMGLLIVMLAASHRVKVLGLRAGSITARLGLALHWASLLGAMALIAAGGWVLAKGPNTDDTQMFFACVLWGLAAVVWLAGKGARFVLTGPLPAPARASASRTAIPPSRHVIARGTGPWGPRRPD